MIEWWRLAGWPSAEEWQAVWSLVTVLVAAIAAIVALQHYKASVASQIEQARPVVVVDYLFKGSIYACIAVTNAGQTGARDITFEWSQRPIAENEATQAAIDRALIDGGIPFLAPGRTIIYGFNVFDGNEPIDRPRRFEVKASYLGSGDRVMWSSESVLDMDQWAETMVAEDPYAAIATPLSALANAAKRQAERDEYLVKAADSLNVYLEAGPRVQMARQRKKDARAEQIAAYRERETAWQARLADERADDEQQSPDGSNLDVRNGG